MENNNEEYNDFSLIKVLKNNENYTIYQSIKNNNKNKYFSIKNIFLNKLSKEEINDYIKDCKILKLLKNRFILKIYNYYLTEENLLIIFEYLNGGFLSEFLSLQRKKKSLIKEEIIWKIYIQLILGLNKIHNNNIIHRDLKTQNIFLTKHFNVKIFDFKKSKILNDSKEFSNSFIGTPYYFSPEMVLKKKYNFKIDVWAIGIILYEICTLQKPFVGKNVEELNKNILKGKFKEINKIYSKELKKVLNMLLIHQQEKRPNVYDLIQDYVFVSYGKKMGFGNFLPKINVNNDKYNDKNKKDNNNNNKKNEINSKKNEINSKKKKIDSKNNKNCNENNKNHDDDNNENEFVNFLKKYYNDDYNNSMYKVDFKETKDNLNNNNNNNEINTNDLGHLKLTEFIQNNNIQNNENDEDEFKIEENDEFNEIINPKGSENVSLSKFNMTDNTQFEIEENENFDNNENFENENFDNNENLENENEKKYDFNKNPEILEQIQEKINFIKSEIKNEIGEENMNKILINLKDENNINNLIENYNNSENLRNNLINYLYYNNLIKNNI